MLRIDKNKKVWITSDTHYNHNNICRGVTNWRMPDGSVPIKQTRDFPTLEKMNETIIRNINNVVGQDDILIHLGDWAFGGFDSIGEFRDRILCQTIHLVFGNHDHHIERNRENCQRHFASVQDFLRFEYMSEVIESFHYPISSWNSLKRGRIHLHGHCHLADDVKIGNGRRLDCGMDGHPEFRPYDLHRECIIPLKKRKIGSELGELDHHTDNIQNIDT